MTMTTTTTTTKAPYTVTKEELLPPDLEVGEDGGGSVVPEEAAAAKVIDLPRALIGACSFCVVVMVGCFLGDFWFVGGGSKTPAVFCFTLSVFTFICVVVVYTTFLVVIADNIDNDDCDSKGPLPRLAAASCMCVVVVMVGCLAGVVATGGLVQDIFAMHYPVPIGIAVHISMTAGYTWKCALDNLTKEEQNRRKGSTPSHHAPLALSLALLCMLSEVGSLIGLASTLYVSTWYVSTTTDDEFCMNTMLIMLVLIVTFISLTLVFIIISIETQPTRPRKVTASL